jgi:hypothetical protein
MKLCIAPRINEKRNQKVKLKSDTLNDLTARKKTHTLSIAVNS